MKPYAIKLYSLESTPLPQGNYMTGYFTVLLSDGTTTQFWDSIPVMDKRQASQRVTADYNLAAGFHRKHKASRPGYCRKYAIGSYEPYKGRYGEGYIKRLGRHNNSTNFESIEYYILKKRED